MLQKIIGLIQEYLKNPYSNLKYNNREWFKEISKCQEEIANLCTNLYYKTNYQKEEALYWLNIPKWIYYDSTQNKVRSILDIGCAYGTLSLYALKKYKCEVFATDFIDAYLSEQLIAKYGFTFKINNIELDPLPWKRTFDRIIFTEVVEHLFNPLEALKKINTMLSTNGKLFLSTPDAKEWGGMFQYYNKFDEIISNPKSNTQKIDAHIYIYKKEELERILELSGFRIEKFDYSPGIGHRHLNVIAVKK